MKYLNIGHNLNTFFSDIWDKCNTASRTNLISGMFIARLKFHNYLGAA